MASLFKMGTFFKGKNWLPPRGNEFFPLRAALMVWKITYIHIRWPPLNVTIFITHMRNKYQKICLKVEVLIDLVIALESDGLIVFFLTLLPLVV